MKGFAKINKEVFSFLRPYVIAEIGVNHGGSLDLAKQMIEEVSEAGGHAAKFQTYKADLIASKHSPAYWDTNKEPSISQHALFKKYDCFGEEEYQILAKYCKQLGIDFLSTPFDLGAVDMLDALVPCFKIASADITNIPLLRKVASKGKPVVLSTGASTFDEIDRALIELKEYGVQDIALLHCVLNYPTPEDHAQLKGIQRLQNRYRDTIIGYSDHVAPRHDGAMPALELASVMGALIIEKHYTYDKTLPGNDHYHSMEKADLVHFLDKLAIYDTLTGNEMEKNLSFEESARKEARRSIVAAITIHKGVVLSEENLITKRPAHGISPLYWDDVIGKKAKRNIEADDLIAWDDLE